MRHTSERWRAHRMVLQRVRIDSSRASSDGSELAYGGGTRFRAYDTHLHVDALQLHCANKCRMHPAIRW